MTRPIALISQSTDMGFLRPLLLEEQPDLNVVVWPDDRCLDAEIAVCWNTPPGLYARMPQLRLVHGVAAGVDNIVDGQDTAALRMCRVVDPDQAAGMCEYVLWAVLHFHRRLDEAMANQAAGRWHPLAQARASACRVGVMGLGALGVRVAESLTRQGYAVRAWARTLRRCEHAEVFAGVEALPAFLAGTDILVCLLPLTAETRDVLGRSTFDALPKGATLVHCGRGGHLVEADLIAALQSGRVRGAILDVFAQEPLPVDHPFWTAPGVVITPHVATSTSHMAIARQVVENIGRYRRGDTLLHEVDLVRGY